MPRFVGRPVIVEACQFQGTIVFLPDPFRLAVSRHFPDGTVGVNTAGGLRSCKYNDWIVRGPDGQFTVMIPATFETMFAPQEAVSPVPEPVASMPAGGREIRRKTANG